MVNKTKVQAKLTRNLLDLIILQFLNTQPMHGYQLKAKIRENFGISFGHSTIYPLINTLEKDGYVESAWEMKGKRPRRVYKITAEGQNLLNFTECLLNLLCRKISTIGTHKTGSTENDVYIKV